MSLFHSGSKAKAFAHEHPSFFYLTISISHFNLTSTIKLYLYIDFYLTLFIDIKKTGNFLSYQQGNPQVFSALKSLTSVFGMGTGISSLLSSPETFCFSMLFYFSTLKNIQIIFLLGKTFRG